MGKRETIYFFVKKKLFLSLFHPFFSSLGGKTQTFRVQRCQTLWKTNKNTVRGVHEGEGGDVCVGVSNGTDHRGFVCVSSRYLFGNSSRPRRPEPEIFVFFLSFFLLLRMLEAKKARPRRP